MTTEQPWPWPETMDALLAAPASHRLLHSVENIDEHRYHAFRIELK